jgi:hypothetical protein
MKRYLKFLLVAIFAMTAIMINPPGGIPPGGIGKRIPIPGKPPVIVVFPSSK